ncbi:ComEC/Rec2 family competence protein [Crassaminicella indica]|uniref:MBL fold metallo-hydrolase n=1 Tax=Crassaminicella indica TaxID=2855394 RepID=A0ABX8RE73_9CLOT|nr:ComEC/Rec2 family competence protein [Crassaminicella indica]QXM07081.1 MBL fold metallo-hydrolase [Crassaminicella indica]
MRNLSKKHYLLIIIAFLLVLTACAKEQVVKTSQEKTVGTEAVADVKGNLKVHFIDVGQADSILIENGENNMLIDAGNNMDSDLVVNYLKREGIKKLDYVIGTHPHEDHIGGLDAVINTFDIGKVYMPKVTHNSKTFKDVVTAIKNKGLKITTPVVGSKIVLGDAQGVILAPNSKEYKDYNNYSIVLKLTYGNTSFLFTGDAEDISEEEMIRKGFDLSADVLKVGHHGSHSSTTLEFLNKVNPAYAVIMCETGNDYGHPHKETMDKLKNKNIPVYRTDENGTIIAVSDGEKIKFNVNPGDYSYGRGSNTEKASINKNKSSQDNIFTAKAESYEEKAYVDKNGNGLIKGNINSKGEKIYHMPDGAYYKKVNAEVLFKTEREAQEAGFRKSKK